MAGLFLNKILFHALRSLLFTDTKPLRIFKHQIVTLYVCM